MENLISNQKVKELLFAGNAILTFQNSVSKNRFTYKISKIKDEHDKFFVSVLRGPSNTDDYCYIGLIDNNNFRTTKNVKISQDSLSIKGFEYIFNLIIQNRINKDLEVYSNCHCCRCGRLLTTPESIMAGIGPYCEGAD